MLATSFALDRAEGIDKPGKSCARRKPFMRAWKILSPSFRCDKSIYDIKEHIVFPNKHSAHYARTSTPLSH